MNRHTGRELYKRITYRRYLSVLVLSLVCAMTFAGNVLIGPAWLSVKEVLQTIMFFYTDAPLSHSIVWSIRMPAAVMAVVVGAALGIAGAQMQTILNNPLASPFTLGVSAGAGFGAALAIVLGVGVIPYVGTYLIAVNAFTFSLLACLFIYLISTTVRASVETMVLTGIALMFLFQSLLGLMQYVASAEQLQTIVFWLFGSLAQATWPKVGAVGMVLLTVLPFFSRNAWKLTSLRLGDEKAKSLGIDTQKLRLKTFVAISFLTAAAVSFVGTIGFIGLVSPHIARMIVGEDQRFFMPLSGLAGAALLSMAAVGSKIIIPGTLFPIGIMTSLIGVPFFFYLVVKRGRGYW